ncbi:MAG: hypothetical protein ACQGQP_09255, partial [Desulfovibrio sp.]
MIWRLMCPSIKGGACSMQAMITTHPCRRLPSMMGIMASLRRGLVPGEDPKKCAARKDREHRITHSFSVKDP